MGADSRVLRRNSPGTGTARGSLCRSRIRNILPSLGQVRSAARPFISSVSSTLPGQAGEPVFTNKSSFTDFTLNGNVKGPWVSGCRSPMPFRCFAAAAATLNMIKGTLRPHEHLHCHEEHAHRVNYFLGGSQARGPQRRIIIAPLGPGQWSLRPNPITTARLIPSRSIAATKVSVSWPLGVDLLKKQLERMSGSVGIGNSLSPHPENPRVRWGEKWPLDHRRNPTSSSLSPRPTPARLFQRIGVAGNPMGHKRPWDAVQIGKHGRNWDSCTEKWGAGTGSGCSVGPGPQNFIHSGLAGTVAEKPEQVRWSCSARDRPTLCSASGASLGKLPSWSPPRPAGTCRRDEDGDKGPNLVILANHSSASLCQQLVSSNRSRLEAQSRYTSLGTPDHPERIFRCWRDPGIVAQQDSSRQSPICQRLQAPIRVSPSGLRQYLSILAVTHHPLETDDAGLGTSTACLQRRGAHEFGASAAVAANH